MTIWMRLSMAVLSGVVGACLCIPTAHAVTYPGKNNSLAFSQASRGAVNVWTVQNNQTRPHQVTYFGAKSPVWSPDGQKMVVVSSWGQLFILDQHGKTLAWLPYMGGFTDDAPTWSPDGSRVAFVRTQLGSGRSAVLAVAIQTRNITNISGWLQTGGYRAPSWAPDSQRVAYERFGSGKRALFIKNTLTGTFRQLTVLSDDIDSNVTWSPNGKKLLFNDSVDQAYTIWQDGSHRTVISDGDSRSAVWSPDGTEIAFIEDNGISISEADGTVTQVYAGNTDQLANLCWSPDSSKIAFVSSNDRGSSGIDMLDIASQKVRHVVSPTSQPDALSWQAKM